MTYEVRCACGKAKRVSGADAGGRVTCECGQTVEVPPLHELRAAVGEGTGLSPAVRIEALLLAGRLPGTRTCPACFEDTDNVVKVRVECARAEQVAETSSEQQASGCLLGFLAGGLLGGLLGTDRLGANPGTKPKDRGQDVAFALPLPVCAACRSKLLAPGALHTALGTVPEYAELLKCYPRAAVALL